MSTQENKALVRRVIELWNRRDMDAFFEICAPEYVEHLPSGDLSLEQLKKYAPTFFAAFPDIQLTISDIVAEGDRVACYIKWGGTHKGPMMNIPPTGKNVKLTQIDMYRIENGKVIERRVAGDRLGLLEQLGVAPPKGRA